MEGIPNWEWHPQALTVWNLQTTILQTEVTSIGEDDLLNDLLKEVEVCIRNGSMPFIFYGPF